MAEAREIYGNRGGPRLLLAELAHLGRSDTRAVGDFDLPEHRHEDAWELCLIRRGAVDWWVGEELHRVTAGQLYLTRPGEEHGGELGWLQPCEALWVQVKLDRRLPGVPAAEAAALREAFGALRRRRYPAGEGVDEAFDDLLTAHRPGAAFPRTVARAALHRLLTSVLASHDAAGPEAEPSPPIRRAMTWMRRRLGEGGPVAEAAAVAGLSPTRFHERFRAETGQSPAAWRTRHRLAAARRLLATVDRPVTEVALRCGFPTGQHFATVFRHHVGMTPTAFRARARGG